MYYLRSLRNNYNIFNITHILSYMLCSSGYMLNNNTVFAIAREPFRIQLNGSWYRFTLFCSNGQMFHFNINHQTVQFHIE
jgi:hypothetical protein